MFRHKNRKGFTLAEALLAVVLLSMAAAGVLLPFTSGAVVRAEGAKRTLASKLASDLMEKVINTDYSEIVGLYNYTEAKGAISKEDGIGGVFASAHYSDFSRSVNSEYVYMPQESGLGQAVFVLVTVRVYHNDIEKVVLKRLIGK